MTAFSTSRKLASEFLGTGLLLAMIIGSGIMAERLSGGNAGLALLCNVISITTGLVALITILGPISGAHFNPVVTLIFAIRRDIALPLAAAYIPVQIAGAVLGVAIAHAMFGQPLLQIAAQSRDGLHLFLSEAVATFVLIVTVLGCIRFKPDFTPTAVGLYITSACWFTASASFANPAVTIARALSDTFCGIAPHSVPAYIAAQVIGALSGLALMSWLLTSTPSAKPINPNAEL